MFELQIDDVDVVVLRRIILKWATDLEFAQAQVEADTKSSRRIDESAFRFINYAQQLGQHASERKGAEE